MVVISKKVEDFIGTEIEEMLIAIYDKVFFLNFECNTYNQPSLLLSVISERFKVVLMSI